MAPPNATPGCTDATVANAGSAIDVPQTGPFELGICQRVVQEIDDLLASHGSHSCETFASATQTRQSSDVACRLVSTCKRGKALTLLAGLSAPVAVHCRAGGCTCTSVLASAAVLLSPRSLQDAANVGPGVSRPPTKPRNIQLCQRTPAAARPQLRPTLATGECVLVCASMHTASMHACVTNLAFVICDLSVQRSVR